MQEIKQKKVLFRNYKRKMSLCCYMGWACLTLYLHWLCICCYTYVGCTFVVTPMRAVYMLLYNDLRDSRLEVATPTLVALRSKQINIGPHLM